MSTMLKQTLTKQLMRRKNAELTPDQLFELGVELSRQTWLGLRDACDLVNSTYQTVRTFEALEVSTAENSEDCAEEPLTPLKQ